ncbi:MAG: hypothetical protein PHV39_08885 [Methanomicrobium sp.]|nr:hypothetical protein [Methanomicrobium sp.]
MQTKTKMRKEGMKTSLIILFMATLCAFASRNALTSGLAPCDRRLDATLRVASAGIRAISK